MKGSDVWAHEALIVVLMPKLKLCSRSEALDRLRRTERRASVPKGVVRKPYPGVCVTVNKGTDGAVEAKSQKSPRVQPFAKFAATL